jgi:hypothetical protein
VSMVIILYIRAYREIVVWDRCTRNAIWRSDSIFCSKSLKICMISAVDSWGRLWDFAFVALESILEMIYAFLLDKDVVNNDGRLLGGSRTWL